jgi:hypothetical protein
MDIVVAHYVIHIMCELFILVTIYYKKSTLIVKNETVRAIKHEKGNIKYINVHRIWGVISTYV